MPSDPRATYEQHALHQPFPGITVTIDAADRSRLEAIVGDRNRPQKHVWRAQIILLTADGVVSSVQRIWRTHGLQPHRVHLFKLSNDPALTTKLRDIVGLYVDPPAHAVALSVDEKSQIQALDRTQPSLLMKKGRAGTMTHDYKGHGTTTLFAALNVLEGKVIGRCMQRHRHQEFIRFLNVIETEVPAGKLVHVILDIAKLTRSCLILYRHGQERLSQVASAMQTLLTGLCDARLHGEC
jgi:hypothetical protein